MSAQIVMDAGGGPVIGSITLDAVDVGTPVTLGNVDDTGVQGWKWEIIDAPETSPSLNPLPPPTFGTTAIITPDVEGHTILVRLTTYSDVARTQLDDVDQKVIRVRFAPPYDWVIPAAQESVEADAIRGWAADVNRMLRETQAFIDAGGGGGAVDSVFTRTGAVVAQASDYDADQVDYDNSGSVLVSTDVQAAIDEIISALVAGAFTPVDSVFGRFGNVTAASGDYDANQVDYDNGSSGLAATDVQAAIDEVAAAGGGGSADLLVPFLACTSTGGVVRGTNGADGFAAQAGVPSEPSGYAAALYGKGIHVLAGDNTISRSIDNGQSWTSETPPSTPVDYRAGCYVERYGRFVIGGDDNGGNTIVHYSADGEFWEEASIAATTSAILGMDSNPDGVVVAATIDDGLWQSQDGGRTWAAVSFTGEQSLYRSVKWCGTQFVAVTNAGGNGIAFSPDGLTWTAGSMGFLGTDSVNDVTRIPHMNRLSAVGENELFYYSDDDGATWTSGLINTPPPSLEGNVVDWVESFGVLISLWGASGHFYASHDGVSWTLVATIVGTYFAANGRYLKGGLAPAASTASGGGGGAVDSVFSRTGAVVAQASDYDANQVDYSNGGSGLTATDVQAAIDEVVASIPAAAPVDSVFSRTGAVVAQASDYDADQVDYANGTSGLAATDVQAAIDEVVAAEADAFHSGTAGEIAALTAATLSGTDHVLIEDADDANNKKRVLASEFFGSGTDPDAIHDNVAGEISAVTEKVTPVAADLILIEDSADANNKKRVQIGNLPGGGSTVVIDPTTWADAAYIGDDMTIDGSGNLTSWPDTNAGQAFAPAGGVPTIPALTGTSGLPASSNWTYLRSAEITDGRTLTATLTSSIAASSPLYVAFYGWVARAATAAYEMILSTDGGIGVSISDLRVQLHVQVAGGGYTELNAGLALAEDSRKAKLWEVLHDPAADSIELWVDGVLFLTRLGSSDLGNRNAVTTQIGFNLDLLSAPGAGVGARVQPGGAVISSTLPTLAQRRGLHAWFAE